MANIDFASLLCSRLCHDLVSPVGAINNGLEVLQEEHDASMRDAVLDLIEKSTKQTSNKLQFFRLAFGAAGGFSSQLDIRECEKAMRAFLDGSRVELNWDIDLVSGNKSFVKLLLNLGLVVSESLIRGGTLYMSAKAQGDKIEIAVLGKGQRVILQEPVKVALEGASKEEDLDPRAAPAFLAWSVANDVNGNITIEKLDQMEVSVKALIDFTGKTDQE